MPSGLITAGLEIAKAGWGKFPAGMDIPNYCMAGLENFLLEWISPTIVWQDWKIPQLEWISPTIDCQD